MESETSSKTYTGQELDFIKKSIEKMSSSNHLKFLQFFVDRGITVNENKSGIRINLGYLYQSHRDVFDDMISLLKTLEKEESIFQQIENEKLLLVKSLKEE